MNTLTKLCRQNTGSHFLDSGGEYGRHWQRPLPTELITIDVDFERNELSATINTPVWLPEVYSIDRANNSAFVCFAAKYKDMGWTEVIELWAGTKGLQVYRDNTCNTENDLSQNIIWYCLSSKDDWYYDSDALWLIQTHNGCDVRGGYSNPVVVKPQTDGGHLTFVVGWRRTDGEEWDIAETGYSSNPTYEISKEISKVIDKIGDEVEIETKDGKSFWITPYVEVY